MGSAVYLSDSDDAYASAPREWIAIPFFVGEDQDGYRLDRFLHLRIPRLSRTRVQSFIVGGQVRGPRGTIDRAAARVRAGEVVVLMRPAPFEPAVPMDFREVYRDDELLVIDKPAGLPVHPSARYHLHTLTALLRTRLGVGHGWEMAHRLDKDTSGVMLFGRRRGSGAALKRAFQARAVAKQYLALVHGTLSSATTIDVPLGPAQGTTIRVKMGPRPTTAGGLPARTDVVPLCTGSFRDQPVTLVRALPRTGRQHQIRVHLDHLGHGVVGDKLYGVDEQLFIDIVEGGRPMAELEAHLGITRHALHAERVVLPHPRHGGEVEFAAPWPAELAAIVPLPQLDP